MSVAIIDYGAGNIQSIRFALERLGISAMLTSSKEKIKAASHVIFPGVGEASSAMTKLQSTGLDTLIPALNSPYWVFVWECNSCVTTRKKGTPKAWVFSTLTLCVLQRI